MAPARSRTSNHTVSVAASPEPPRRRAHGALLGHRGLEAGDIDRAALLAQRVLRQVERKTVGVVEPERHVARQRTALAKRAVSSASSAGRDPASP